ncbi:hypothetical protein GBB76_13160 [Ancylobacter sp. TS-1]|nr:hypothetical protein GBB76_13160 [Ancylobacter sp. TS-1]
MKVWSALATRLRRSVPDRLALSEVRRLSMFPAISHYSSSGALCQK